MSFKEWWKRLPLWARYVIFGVVGGFALLLVGIIIFILMAKTGNELLAYSFIIGEFIVLRLYPNISPWGGAFAAVTWGLIADFFIGFIIAIIVYHFKIKK